ncbi:MAG: hypothetical protein QOE70_4353 [Chthoniobacter sp.]|jgi:DNA-directed RNA polymerase subunit RPC12/RpoP|nr:hypothetical protein [Chthoniobacter sp.]
MNNAYTISADGRSITCHACGRTSHNSNDVREKYCGHCHRFLSDPDLDLEARFLAALGHHAKTPVILHLDALSVFELVAALQLACRHPGFSALMKERVSGFVQAAREKLGALDPLFSQVIERGEKPQFDT